LGAVLAIGLIASSPIYDDERIISVPLPPPPAAAITPPINVHQVARVAARMHGVDPAVVLSIIKAESGFRADAVSAKGALGLMQVMPDTAAEMGYDPTVPEENIQAGTEYVKFLLSRYQNRRNGLSLAIAAYNAGPGNVDRYRGVPPFAETRAYVKRVIGFCQDYRRSAKSAQAVIAASSTSQAEAGD
jgi:soluble lytic murein transglycosylase-like protein